MKKRKYVREKPLAEAEADPPGRQALEGGANEPLMLPEGRTAGQKLLPEPEQKKLLTAGDADEKTMMSAFAENTGQARGSTEINTEAPEIEGWKGGKGQATGQATQGGKDTLGLEGARDAEAKDFAMMRVLLFSQIKKETERFRILLEFIYRILEKRASNAINLPINDELL